MANETKPPEWIAEAVDALPPSTYIMRRDSMIDHFEEAWKEAKDKEPPPPPCPECERLRRERDDAILERYEALGVKTTEGLTASEWVLRTGKAEKELDAALARAEEADGLLKRAREAIDPPGSRLADEIDAYLGSREAKR